MCADDPVVGFVLASFKVNGCQRFECAVLFLSVFCWPRAAMCMCYQMLLTQVNDNMCSSPDLTRQMLKESEGESSMWRSGNRDL